MQKYGIVVIVSRLDIFQAIKLLHVFYVNSFGNQDALRKGSFCICPPGLWYVMHTHNNSTLIAPHSEVILHTKGCNSNMK